MFQMERRSDHGVYEGIQWDVRRGQIMRTLNVGLSNISRQTGSILIFARGSVSKCVL